MIKAVLRVRLNFPGAILSLRGLSLLRFVDLSTWSPTCRAGHIEDFLIDGCHGLGYFR